MPFLVRSEVIMFSADAMNGVRRHALAGLVGVAVFLLTGCGDGRVRVHGSVIYDGKPVEEGTIAFEPADGQGPSTGGPIADGKYDLKGNARATTGEKIVRIIASCKTGRKIPIPPPAHPGTTIDERIQCIPNQYNERSTLRVQVTGGKDNNHDFDLKAANTTR
jgi:hypothetical protein